MKFFCLDCNHVVSLTRNGYCEVCGSDALAIAESLRPAEKESPEEAWLRKTIEEASRK
jgi:rRNA maturation endonuclease Nob1